MKARPYQLIRQHNWAFFVAIVLLEKLAWPDIEINKKTSGRNDLTKFYDLNVASEQAKEIIVNLLDDFGVS